MLANLVLVCEDGLLVVVVALSSGSQATTVAELNPISCNSVPTKPARCPFRVTRWRINTSVISLARSGETQKTLLLQMIM